MRRSRVARDLAFGVMMAGAFHLVCAAPWAVAAGRAGTRENSPATSQARKGIDAANARYLEAARKGDAARIAALFNEEGALLQVSGKIIRGRQSIRKFLKAQFEELGILTDGSFAIRDVFVLGSMAYETGTYKLTYEHESEPGPTLEGTYVREWKRQPTGVWKIYRDLTMPKEPRS